MRTFPSGLQVVDLPPDTDPRETARSCLLSGCFEFAEPDFRVQLTGVFPDDPHFQQGALWGLHNTGQAEGIADADIDAPEGWAIQTGARGVVVAIIDTGIRSTHEDLASNLWTNPADGSHGFNAFDGSHSPTDETGHGTSVAGIIGAVGNNGLGVVGVCWEVQLMACKFADVSGGFISDAISCLDFARTNGAQVINTSWGIYESSAALSNALQTVSEQGIIVVAAAGNDLADIDSFPYFPAAYPFTNLISVGGSTRTDDFYFLSNFGTNSVDLAAPAEAVFSSFRRSDNDYATEEGTSMAAGYVSGTAALLRSRYSQAPASWIVERILTTTDRLPSLIGKSATGGRLNLQRALESVPFILTARASASGASIDLLLQGDPNAIFVLEGANHVSRWSPVLTNALSIEGGWGVSTNPAPGQSQIYFRAHY